MGAVAIIPARGGSKRLPRKNIIDFLGKPIIAYTIGAALESGCFAKVVVSTEDDEIASVAREYGAEADRRAQDLATDTATVVEVCLEFLTREKEAGRDWDVFACLYATAPLRTAGDIRTTVSLLDAGCHFAMAITSYDLPPHQALRGTPDGFLEPMWPQLATRRASELPDLHVDCGSTYAAQTSEFRRQKTFYGSTLKGHYIPRSRAVDIDTADDLSHAVWLAERARLANPA